MHNALIFLLLLSISALDAQNLSGALLDEKYLNVLDSNAMIVKGRNYEGVLLFSNRSPNYRIGVPDLDAYESWEVSFNHIRQFESCLQKAIQAKAGLFGDSRLSGGRLSKYLRQYLGVIDKNGRKKILVGFIFKTTLEYSSLLEPQELFEEFVRIDTSPASYFLVLYDAEDQELKMVY